MANIVSQSRSGGEIKRLTPKFTRTANTTALPSTSVDTPILTIRNEQIYNNDGTYSTTQYLPNYSELKLKEISASSDSNKPVTIKIIRNATLGAGTLADSPRYLPVNVPNSCTFYDVESDTLTGGQELFAVQLGKVDNVLVDLEDFDIILANTESITISGATSNATNDVTVSLTWVEDH